MTGTMQNLSLLCCFALFFLLPYHLAAGPSTPLRAPESAAISSAKPRADASLQNQTAAPRSDIQDIYGPISLPESPPYRLYGLGALLIAAAAALLLAVLRFRKKEKTVVRIDAGARALAELHKAGRKRLETGDVPGYCDHVTATLRTYVEEVTGYRISSRTTLESLNELVQRTGRSLISDPDRLDLLRRCLSRCDMVKFARFAPDQHEAERIGTLAEAFISSTSAGEGA